MGGKLPNSAPQGPVPVKYWAIFFAALVLLVIMITQRDVFAQTLWKATHWAPLVSLSDDPQFLYEAGMYYMDSASEAQYNLEHAEKMLYRAMEIDPSHRYGFHQLARIAFLHADFEKALALINIELQKNPSPSPSSYYIRALIKGYMDDFGGAAMDYETYLKTDPRNWAAINDYGWVLIKQGRLSEALIVLDWGLLFHDGNPWLLNSKATALFELDRIEQAQEVVAMAVISAANITEAEWLRAYPGNDPLIAKEGVETFKKSVEENMHTISLAHETETKNVQ